MSVKKLQINYNTISAVGKWKVQPYPTVPKLILKVITKKINKI